MQSKASKGNKRNDAQMEHRKIIARALREDLHEPYRAGSDLETMPAAD
jgi:hypothetical protein